MKYLINESFRKSMLNDFYHPTYHLIPPGGWLNDPNGLCKLGDTYHIFYQFAINPEGGLKSWGHYTTKDFHTFKEEPIALYPDIFEDRDGVYSGTALVENGMHLFYTGNVKYEGDYDYITSGRGSFVNHVFSENGFDFSSKQVLLSNKNYPSNISAHVRDPRVIKKNNEYYMYLGARDLNNEGLVLVYTSNDLTTWTFKEEIRSVQPFGYMWECPDLISFNNLQFLIVCPQGIKQNGYTFENENQNGYFTLNGNIASNFVTLDYGFDFYAPQCFNDGKRIIMIGWVGQPDESIKNPTVQKGWQHALSLPRELQCFNNKLYQYPIEEVLSLQTASTILEVANKPITLESNACHLHFHIVQDLCMQIANMQISYENELFTLKYEEEHYGRTARHIDLVKLSDVDIFLDNSIIEIYLNNGEKVMTNRYYNESKKQCISSRSKLMIEYSKINCINIIQ